MVIFKHCLALILLIVGLLAPSLLASLLAPTVSCIPSRKRSNKNRYLLIASIRARFQPPIFRFGMES